VCVIAQARTCGNVAREIRANFKGAAADSREQGAHWSNTISVICSRWYLHHYLARGPHPCAHRYPWTWGCISMYLCEVRVYYATENAPRRLWRRDYAHIRLLLPLLCREGKRFWYFHFIPSNEKSSGRTENGAEQHRGNVIVEASLEIKRDIVAGFHRNNICKNSALAGIIIYLRPRSICCFHKAQTRQSWVGGLRSYCGMCSPPFASNIAARYLGDEAFLVVGAAQFLQPLHLSRTHMGHRTR